MASVFMAHAFLGLAGGIDAPEYEVLIPVSGGSVGTGWGGVLNFGTFTLDARDEVLLLVPRDFVVVELFLL